MGEDGVIPIVSNWPLIRGKWKDLLEKKKVSISNRLPKIARMKARKPSQSLLYQKKTGGQAIDGRGGESHQPGRDGGGGLDLGKIKSEGYSEGWDPSFVLAPVGGKSERKDGAPLD